MKASIAQQTIEKGVSHSEFDIWGSLLFDFSLRQSNLLSESRLSFEKLNGQASEVRDHTKPFKLATGCGEDWLLVSR